MNKSLCIAGLIWLVWGAIRLTTVRKIGIDDFEHALDELATNARNKSDSAKTLAGVVDISIGLFLLALSSLVGA